MSPAGNTRATTCIGPRHRAARRSGRTLVLDLYGVLAASGGWLRPEYTDDPYDSHLNADAYRALDGELSKALGE